MALTSKNKVDPNFNMSSMTDMIFLLLIFFMLTSSFVSPGGLQLLLPTSATPQKTVTASIRLEITKDKAFTVNGTVFPEDLLEDEVKTQLEDADEKIVNIVAHEEVPTQYLVTAAGIAAKYNAKISVSTTK